MHWSEIKPKLKLFLNELIFKRVKYKCKQQNVLHHHLDQVEVLYPIKEKQPSTVSVNLTVLVATIDAQWEGMGDVGSARYEPALLPPCPTIRVLSYSNQ